MKVWLVSEMVIVQILNACSVSWWVGCTSRNWISSVNGMGVQMVVEMRS